MRVFLVLSAILAVALSDDVTKEWNTLKVRWGINPFGGYFRDIPMTLNTALNANYQSHNVDNEFNLTSMIYNVDESRIVPLYAVQGHLAGILVVIPRAQIENKLPASYKFENTPGFKRQTVLGTDSWTAAFYFYSPETIRAGQQLPKDASLTLEKELWFREGESHVKAPTTVTEALATTKYTKQACIPTMGGHLYWDMSETTSCNQIPPFFMVTHKDSVCGVGFQMFGKVDDLTWHEKPDRAAVEMIVPRGPACLYDIVEQFGVTTTHFFFEKNPALNFCL